MQQPVMARFVRRQLSPAAYSGVTDQISNIGQSAGDKVKSATSGLTSTQTSVVVVFTVLGCLFLISGLFWICSCSRRRKRAKEMKEKSETLQSVSTSTFGVASAPKADRSSRHLGVSNDGWGESRVALNSSFVAWANERYGWEQDHTHYAGISLPQAPQQSHRY